MKKRDLTKLALMGLASGCLLSQASVEAQQSALGGINSGILIAKSCGSGCSGTPAPQTKNNGQTADNSDYNRPQSSCGGQRQTASCSASSNPSRPQSSCGGQSQTASCGGQRNRPQASCGGYTADNDTRTNRYNDSNSNRYSNDANDNQTTDNDTIVAPSSQDEQKALNQLNVEGKRQYQSLDNEGKALAIKLINQSCKGKNDCKGLNSCKSDKNSCAGQGGCKGTSKGPFTDKNVAVKVAAKKMADKRNQLNS